MASIVVRNVCCIKKIHTKLFCILKVKTSLIDFVLINVTACCLALVYSFKSFANLSVCQNVLTVCCYVLILGHSPCGLECKRLLRQMMELAVLYVLYMKWLMCHREDAYSCCIFWRFTLDCLCLQYMELLYTVYCM